MQLTYCDLCGEPIKVGEKKYILGVHCVTEEPEEERQAQLVEVLKELYKEMKTSQRRVQVYEMCPKCLQVFLRFITLRKSDLDKAKREVSRLLKKKLVNKEKEKKQTSEGETKHARV